MIFKALLTLASLSAAPSAEPPPPRNEDAHTCKVEWSDHHDDEMYKELAAVAILQRCDNLLIALNYEAEADSVVIRFDAQPSFLETFESTVSITLPGEDSKGIPSSSFETDEACPCPSVVSLANFTLQQVAEAVEQSRKPPPPQGTDSPSDTAGAPQDTSTGERGTLTPLGKAGIGVAAVGLAAGITGAALFLPREDTPEFGPNDEQRNQERFRFRNAAVGLSVGGGVALGAGITMLLLDLRRSKEQPSKTTTVAPALSPEGAGISILGRF